MKIFLLALLVTTLTLTIAGYALAGCPCCSGAKAMNAPAQGLAESTAAGEKTAAAEPEATPICPVMGGKADKNISYEYQGKTYYFCCPACIEQFKANPEKYIN